MTKIVPKFEQKRLVSCNYYKTRCINTQAPKLIKNQERKIRLTGNNRATENQMIRKP